ncbi:hypothetical protein EVAR_31185_1 [Eumeta japonica]|uniref:Uncharacterized protein n=1 Tax=Eumeta variegata TaxID=151549 RepID=A0A4C1VWU7_EUMVA|nr:hypothetical protein EVAR_31185_1 [Eumeta japonica]
MPAAPWDGKLHGVEPVKYVINYLNKRLRIAGPRGTEVTEEGRLVSGGRARRGRPRGVSSPYLSPIPRELSRTPANLYRRTGLAAPTDLWVPSETQSRVCRSSEPARNAAPSVCLCTVSVPSYMVCGRAYCAGSK